MDNENLEYKIKIFLLGYFGHRIDRVDYRLYIYIPNELKVQTFMMLPHSNTGFMR